MAGVRARDASAFEQLYDTYHRLVYGIALRVLGDRAGAEDVTQAVFLKLWSSPELFRTGNFGAWLARVARNRSLDALRRRMHSDEHVDADAPAEQAVDDEVLAGLEGAHVRAALEQLPREQREPIELGFFSGLTHEEIAQRTGAPLGTVKTRIRSGLRRLRAGLESGARV